MTRFSKNKLTRILQERYENIMNYHGFDDRDGWSQLKIGHRVSNEIISQAVDYGRKEAMLEIARELDLDIFEVA